MNAETLGPRSWNDEELVVRVDAPATAGESAGRGNGRRTDDLRLSFAGGRVVLRPGL